MFGKNQWCSGLPPGLVFPLSLSVCGPVSGVDVHTENFCVLGLASFLIIRMYFGKAANDFNQSIQGQGENGPQLIANTSNAFTSELSSIFFIRSRCLSMSYQWFGLAMHFSLYQ